MRRASGPSGTLPPRSDRAKSPRPCICSSEASFDFSVQIACLGLVTEGQVCLRGAAEQLALWQTHRAKVGRGGGLHLCWGSQTSHEAADASCVCIFFLCFSKNLLICHVHIQICVCACTCTCAHAYMRAHTHTTLLTQRTGFSVTLLEYFLWVI